jgi:hypothetical protein
MGLMKFISDGFINWLTKEREVIDFPLCDFERIRYEVRPCDVLLMEGRNHVSDVIKFITQSAWSHAALYLGRIHDIEDPIIRNKAMEFFNGSPDTQLLIEGMIGKGTIISPLSMYRQDHIRICRPRGLSPHDSQHIIDFAVSKLGDDYDMRQIFDLARFLLPWTIMPRRWHSTLFSKTAGDSTRNVCSTMIAEAFNSVHFPILPYIKKSKETGIELFRKNPRLFTPRDFDYSPYFEIIKYPFVAFDDQAAYRKLPWNKDGRFLHENEKDPETVNKNKYEDNSEPYD